MIGSPIPDDIQTVQNHLTAFKLCDLGLREAFTAEAEATGPVHDTLMEQLRLLPGARGLVVLARICREEILAGKRLQPPAPHVADARELLTHLLPAVTWHAIARAITLSVKAPESEPALRTVIAKDLRPRIHRTIRCAAVADPDAAVKVMVATAALAVAWTEKLHRHAGTTAMISGVANLAMDLDSLSVLTPDELGYPGISHVEPILYSPRRRQGAVAYDRAGIAAKEQAALQDLALCARNHGGLIEAMRNVLPPTRYTFARLLLNRGRHHSRDLSHAASLRRWQHSPRLAGGRSVA